MEQLEAGDPRQVGRYRITARLGAGGMGRVYLGRSASGRAVAVKVVRAELAEDPGFRARFALEIEAASRVTGFFTAAVVDADPEGSPAWLATAYVPGTSLEDAVRTHGALPQLSVQALGAGLAEALEAIHRVGLIHRDLKPSNVLLAADGPRVIDFGISKAVEASGLTRTGMVIGTPGFMSPEQVTGKPVGPAGDVFSLGAVLAFAATGTSPFGTGSAHAVNFRAVYEEADLGRLPSGLAAVRRCLAKDPGERPAVPALIMEFAQALGETDAQTAMTHALAATVWPPGPTTRSREPREPRESQEPLATEPRPPEPKTDPGPAPAPAPTARAVSSAQPKPAAARTNVRAAARTYTPPGPAPGLSRRKTLLIGGLVLIIALALTAWWFLVRGEVRSPKWTFATGGSASSPTIAAGTAYVSSYNGSLYAVDVATGNKRWAFNPVDNGGRPSSAAVSGNTVYVATEEKIYAVDARTGKQKWEFDNATNSNGGESLVRPTPPVVRGSTVYINGGTLRGGELNALDAATGKKRWAFRTGSLSTHTPTVSGGTVYVIGQDQARSHLFAIDAESGRKRWEYTGSGSFSHSPAVAHGTVYVHGRELYAVNADNGKRKWSVKAGEYTGSSPTAANGIVYFGMDDSLCAVDAITGEKRWSFKTDNSVHSKPTVADGRVYFGSQDKRVYALDAATGERRWTVEADSYVSSSPAVADGTLYFGSEGPPAFPAGSTGEGTLYAVDIP
ncbi:PQQ-binding-like beta-propeller repeat protein [Streptomyces sp. NBC_00237]|uniref:outer membrane protein assembly factor BamB family protein n=1 Tax=Streptomyces sp. NBC_00237 TaxID=2975687 RepID=UPI0022597E51|nr:PQQ-binding-like beta-propeller repeat protein [Streptomyces sp. NBC_00237]MCX5207245.1 PQQ-binding-like beta-propeller repeat protein [Streptomyces sp. NBC_00237]